MTQAETQTQAEAQQEPMEYGIRLNQWTVTIYRMAPKRQADGTVRDSLVAQSRISSLKRTLAGGWLQRLGAVRGELTPVSDEDYLRLMAYARMSGDHRENFWYVQRASGVSLLIDHPECFSRR